MYFPLFVGGSVFVFVLLWITLCLFQFCSHLEEEERAGCFAFLVLRMFCYCECSVNRLPNFFGNFYQIIIAQ